MSFCDKFKQYILVDRNSEYNVFDFKHIFFRLNNWNEEIQQTENELGITIPTELKEIYKELGYGRLCSSDPKCSDRILYPLEIADFYLQRDVYEYNEVVDEYDINEGEIVFFEVSSDLYITVSLASGDDGGYPVYFIDKKIANSVEEFLIKMDEKVDYYFDFLDTVY